MKTTLLLLAAALVLLPPTLAAQVTDAERSARAAARAAAMNEPRPIEAIESVWIEDLTWMEIWDAIRGGKTTALVVTGGIESNGPHLTSGKHNVSNRLMAESVALALGDALVAPLVTLEPGNPSGPVTLGNTGPMVSQETYIAWLTDIGDSLRGMGFTEVYYNHTQVRHYIQEELGIPEEMEYAASQGSDGIHEELSIAAIMSVYDPETIRYQQRVAAGRASINGISLQPLEQTQALGRQLIELRTGISVEAIEALRQGGRR